MTSTPPPGPGSPTGPTGPRISLDRLRDVGELRRSREDRHVAGVAGGLGRFLDIDPAILRVAFVVLALFGGGGLLLYAAAWLLVPEEGAERARIHLDAPTRGVVLLGVSVVSALMLVGDSSGAMGFPWPVLVVALIAAVVVLGRERSHTPSRVSLSKGPVPGSPPTGVAATGPAMVAGAGGPRPARVRRGPGLFWPAVALVALGLGALWVVDLAGVAVVAGAYPALALALCGLMLVLGAWYGRPGGVYFLAVLAGLGLVSASVPVPSGIGEVTARPTSAASVHDEYDISLGQVSVDLSQVRDPARLSGRTIHLASQVGEVDVIVPPDVDVTVSGSAHVGQVTLFGRPARGGTDVHKTASLDRGPDAPELTIDAEVDYGQVTVTEGAG